MIVGRELRLVDTDAFLAATTALPPAAEPEAGSQRWLGYVLFLASGSLTMLTLVSALGRLAS